MVDRFDSIPRVPQPPSLSVPLFEHQKASIHAMELIENHAEKTVGDAVVVSRLGINANIAGYGKTLEMVGLIIRNVMPWDVSEIYTQTWTSTSNAGLITTRKSVSYQRVHSTLVLASASLLHQWTREIGKSSLSLIAVASRRSIQTLIDLPLANFPDVVLVVDTMFNPLVTSLPVAWRRFIFDEPGQLHVPRMEAPVAGHHWLISATPGDISLMSRRRNSSRGHYQLSVAMSGHGSFELCTKPFTVRTCTEFVKASFAMPATITVRHECMRGVAGVVRGVVSVDVLAMLEAGDNEGARAALGGVSSRNIVEIVMMRQADKVENVRRRLILLLQLSGFPPQTDPLDIRAEHQRPFPAHIKETSAKLERETAKLESLTQRMQEQLTGECPICQCELSAPVLEPECQALFCSACLLRWLCGNATCPLCRVVVKANELVFLSEQNGSAVGACAGKSRATASQRRLTSRAETCARIIREKPDGRMLVFSCHDASFETCKRFLLAEGVRFVELKGCASVRARVLEDFRTGLTNVLLLNSLTNGAGIDLQCATDVILYHSMPAYSEQIVARANRVGRTLPLTVHHLVDRE